MARVSADGVFISLQSFRLRNLGSIPNSSDKRIFSSPKRLDGVRCSDEPSLQCVPETLTPGVKWLGREADHLPLSTCRR